MRFHYQALQADGRVLTGQVEAETVRGAYRDLARRGVRPTAITPAAARTRAGLIARKKASRRDELYTLKELHA